MVGRERGGGTALCLKTQAHKRTFHSCSHFIVVSNSITWAHLLWPLAHWPQSLFFFFFFFNVFYFGHNLSLFPVPKSFLMWLCSSFDQEVPSFLFLLRFMFASRLWQEWCGSSLEPRLFRDLLLSLLESFLAACEQVNKSNQPAGGWRPGETEVSHPNWAQPQRMAHRVMNGINGCLVQDGFSGMQMLKWSQKYKKPVKGKGQEAGSGWGGFEGNGYQSMMFLTSLCQPNSSEDCLLEEPCIAQKWLGLCTTALLSGWLGATLRWEWPRFESHQLTPLLAVKQWVLIPRRTECYSCMYAALF